MPPSHLLRPLFLSLALLLTAACQGPAASSAPQKRLSITEVGAVGDGTTLNTAAILKGIDQLQAAGGGVLVVPAGKFRSGSIFLKPGVELYLDEGAVLFGSDKIEDKLPRLMAATNRHHLDVDTHDLHGLLATREQLLTTRTHRLARIVDRIGGGDAFAAGLLHGLLRDMGDQDALDFAIAAACLKHSVLGDVNLLREPDMLAFHAQEGFEVRR